MVESNKMKSSFTNLGRIYVIFILFYYFYYYYYYYYYFNYLIMNVTRAIKPTINEKMKEFYHQNKEKKK